VGVWVLTFGQGADANGIASAEARFLIFFVLSRLAGAPHFAAIPSYFVAVNSHLAREPPSGASPAPVKIFQVLSLGFHDLLGGGSLVWENNGSREKPSRQVV